MAISAKDLRRLQRALDRVYDDQLRDLIIYREVFRQVGQVWKAATNRSTALDLSNFLQHTYLVAATVGIRRVSEPTPKFPRKGQNTLSLVVLLEELAELNTEFTRDWYVAKYRNKGVRGRFASRDFSEIVGSATANHLPLRQINGDIAAIRRTVAPLKRLVDKAIAHTEADRRRKGRQTWSMIDTAIQLLGTIYRRYYLLLNAASFDPFDVASDVDVAEHLRKIWP